ncbi:hypothetical protein I4U23_001225 [Adineta vaga]|nr:hypothetical protein I4U23_001225 [Adineta vaga]
MTIRIIFWWWIWYLLLVTIDFIQAQNPFNSGVGGGLPLDPFLELTGAVTTPVIQKSTNPDLSCVSQGTLAGAIIGTLLLSAFIAFLTWMVYLRQKLQELQSYENQGKKHVRISSKPHSTISAVSNYKKQHMIHDEIDENDNQFPLDAIDYKFGTFPFRQSQTPSVNGHSNTGDWLTRIPSSFRSATMDKDAQVIDIELLNPTFCGLNFSITGNMRSGIFVKEILDKEIGKGQMKLNSSDQLKAGDRIVALTVCFESIVYEDALTILSYASPYPVILRVQRSTRLPKVKVIKEKRLVSGTTATTNKVKWRDDFEHYDNDTSHNHSSNPLNPTATLTTDTKSTSANDQPRSSSKKPRTSKSPSIPKDVTNNSEATLMPYYDSPYDYYAANVSHAHLNKNNNNSSSTESLTAVTSLCTIEFSPSRILPKTIQPIEDKETLERNIDTFV